MMAMFPTNRCIEGVTREGESVTADLRAGTLLPIVEIREDVVVVEDGDGCRYEVRREDEDIKIQ